MKKEWVLGKRTRIKAWDVCGGETRNKMGDAQVESPGRSGSGG